MVYILAMARSGGGNPSAAANAFSVLLIILVFVFTAFMIVKLTLRDVLYRKILTKYILKTLGESDNNIKLSLQEIVDLLEEENVISIVPEYVHTALVKMIMRGLITTSSRQIGFEKYESVYQLTEDGLSKAKLVSE